MRPARLLSSCAVSFLGFSQVAERALLLWNNEQLVQSGCLSRHFAPGILPIIYGSLYRNSANHWNATVEGLAQNVLKMYMEFDLNLYDRCSTEYFRQVEQKEAKRKESDDLWQKVEEVAAST
mmetsp:Transcript_9993/g.37779  ORF Transcript_9993/g.37779 Transcript_9993/m.37779 type:complete len:122 (-) Transcript_9993:331-696(-)